MPGRLFASVVASFALSLVCAGSAAAAALTFNGRVLRYHTEPGVAATLAVRPSSWPLPTHLRVTLRTPLAVNIGCDQLAPEPQDPGKLELECPRGVPVNQLRYRLVLSDRADSARGTANVIGVIYARDGRDNVSDGYLVRGGRGHDVIAGLDLIGGAGHDKLYGRVGEEYGDFAQDLSGAPILGPNVLFGGPGDDLIVGRGGGRYYGGPGNDRLSDELGVRSGGWVDMLVGGPGRDIVTLKRDNRADVVRTRGGGTDRVNCAASGGNDVLFVDRSDRLSPSCKDATVLYTGRPRYPYP